jgi:hypothetical protein
MPESSKAKVCLLFFMCFIIANSFLFLCTQRQMLHRHPREPWTSFLVRLYSLLSFSHLLSSRSYSKLEKNR